MATRERLPQYLQKYCAEQNYDRYSAEDHAAWRYIMRQSRDYFRQNAVDKYLVGLEKTAIPIDRIPKIDEMDTALSEFGWGAVPVCGFIPPAAFLDFQARKVLPIATDMRTVDHIAYTPAPDIVHEAAGHAPILAYPAYSDYLCRYAQLAQKAIMSDKDIELYQAIRHLSDLKENPDCTPEQIQAAERRLRETVDSIEHVSEATRVARMNWWTVEYGLAGSMEDPKIYGAGLLSSVGESQNCLSANVKKIPFSIECTNVSYDITEPQPQLFVTPDLETLCAVLTQLESQMAFCTGGLSGLEKAKRAKTLTTTKLDSGISATGILESYLCSEEQVEFVKLSGPVQLCVGKKELSGHGRDRHPEGFSSPVGFWKKAPAQPPHTLSPSDLESMGIKIGNKSQLLFKNGFEVSGVVQQILYSEQNLISIAWKDCTVRRGDEIFFEPSWGDFDQLVGASVTSVYGGPGDREAYGEYEIGQATTSPSRQSPYSEEEKRRFKAFEEIRCLRQQSASADTVNSLITAYSQAFSDQWLIQLELLELAKQVGLEEKVQSLEKSLLQTKDKTHKWLAKQGIQVAAIAD